VKVLQAMPSVDPKRVVYGQYRGYRKSKGVAPDSRVETFAALELAIDSWRWKGVPFFIRAGKCLPVTSTEVVVRLRRPPTFYEHLHMPSNYLRFRLGPDHTIAIGANVLAPSRGAGLATEVLCTHDPSAEAQPYERLLTDAIGGDRTLFAREDYVEEAWRIVDPLLKAPPPPLEYEPGSWGPGDVDRRVSPEGGWQNPSTQQTQTQTDRREEQRVQHAEA
jgi:glucose-6-phosphate 1-dehydrogenase